MAYTINGYAFTPQVGSDTGWKRKPILRILTLSGTGRSQTYRTGFEPYRWSFKALIVNTTTFVLDTATKDALEGLQGFEVTFSDGSSSWTAVLEEAAFDQHEGGEAYVGRLVLQRSGT